MTTWEFHGFFFFRAADLVWGSNELRRDLREPLVWHQGSPVYIRFARRSAALLSSHDRVIGPEDALKKESRSLSRVATGNPGFPLLVS